MNSTTTDFKAVAVAVDHDARNLAIVYGSLGTFIAFVSLIFAILSWMRSRYQRLAAHAASDDVELGVNTPRDTVRTPQESESPEGVSHSDHRRTKSAIPAVGITQPQSPFELDGDATMPPRAHESHHTAESISTINPSCGAPVAPQRT